MATLRAAAGSTFTHRGGSSFFGDPQTGGVSPLVSLTLKKDTATLQLEFRPLK